MTLETRNDRTPFFNLIPVGFRAPSELFVKFKLFTVPGQVAHDSTRKAVLFRAEGAVFVADSQRNQNTNNSEPLDNLADSAMRVGSDFENLPQVVQFNKRDLRAEGVLETFLALLKRVYERNRLHLSLEQTMDSFAARWFRRHWTVGPGRDSPRDGGPGQRLVARRSV